MDRGIFLLLLYLSATSANPCADRLLNALPHPTSCEYYILCWHFTPYLMKCPFDLLFDVETNNCQPSAFVDCNENLDLEQFVTISPLPYLHPITESPSELVTWSPFSTPSPIPIQTSAATESSETQTESVAFTLLPDNLPWLPIRTLPPPIVQSSTLAEFATPTDSILTLSPLPISTLSPANESSEPVTASASPSETLPTLSPINSTPIPKQTLPPATESTLEPVTENNVPSEAWLTLSPINTPSVTPIRTLSPDIEMTLKPITETSEPAEVFPTLSPISTPSPFPFVTLSPAIEPTSEPITEIPEPVEIFPTLSPISTLSPLPIITLSPTIESTLEPLTESNVPNEAWLTLSPINSSPMPEKTVPPTIEPTSEPLTENVLPIEALPTLSPINTPSPIPTLSPLMPTSSGPPEVAESTEAFLTLSPTSFSTFTPLSVSTLSPANEATELITEASPSKIFPTLSPIPKKTLPPAIELTLEPAENNLPNEAWPTLSPFNTPFPTPIRTVLPEIEPTSEPVTENIVPNLSTSVTENTPASSSSPSISSTEGVTKGPWTELFTFSPNKEPWKTTEIGSVTHSYVEPTSIDQSEFISTTNQPSPSSRPYSTTTKPTTNQSHIFLPPILRKNLNQHKSKKQYLPPLKVTPGITPTMSSETLSTSTPKIEPPISELTASSSEDITTSTPTLTTSNVNISENASQSSASLVSSTTEAPITEKVIPNASTSTYLLTTPSTTGEISSTTTETSYEPSKLSTIDHLTTEAVPTKPSIKIPNILAIEPPERPIVITLLPDSAPWPSALNKTRPIAYSPPPPPATAPINHSPLPTTTASPMTSTSFKPGTLPPCLVQNILIIPDPLDCKYFFYCEHGFWYHYSCHYGQEFSAVELKCMRPWHAQCRAKSYF